jgi:hypothetical protein
MNSKKRVLLQISNVIALFLTILFNALSGIRIFNGKTIGEISDNYPNLFTPAGFTFSIWSIIYLSLIIYVFYQAKDVLKAQKEEMLFIEQVSIFFIISCGLNILWLIVWLYEFILLSVIVMLLLLLDLIIIYLRLNIARNSLNKGYRKLVWIPFSLYLGWISIATIANITVFLVSINWDGFGISPFVWTVIILGVALTLTLIILYTRKDYVFPLVTMWALFGIFIKRLTENYELAIIAIIMIIVIALNIVYFKIRKKD